MRMILEFLEIIKGMKGMMYELVFECIDANVSIIKLKYPLRIMFLGLQVYQWNIWKVKLYNPQE